MYTANSKTENKQLQIIRDRQTWIDHLIQNEVTKTYTKQENELIEWTKTTISHRKLMELNNQTSWRSKLTK